MELQCGLASELSRDKRGKSLRWPSSGFGRVFKSFWCSQGGPRVREPENWASLCHLNKEDPICQLKSKGLWVPATHAAVKKANSRIGFPIMSLWKPMGADEDSRAKEALSPPPLFCLTSVVLSEPLPKLDVTQKEEDGRGRKIILHWLLRVKDWFLNLELTGF